MFVTQRSSIVHSNKFKEWKHIVASIVFFHIRKDVDDLADHDYYKIYTSGIPASVMADIVIKQS